MPFQPGRKKTGGRLAGVPNHATVAHRAAILKSGLSPIDYLTSVYRDPSEPTSVRVDAARTVCAYIYPKLSSVDVDGRVTQPMVVQVIRFGDTMVEDTTQIGRVMPAIDAEITGVATDVTAHMLEAIVRDEGDDVS